MKQLVLLLAIASLVVPAGAFAQAPPGSDNPPPGSGLQGGPPAGDPSGRHGPTASQLVLRKKVEAVDWEDTPLEDVVEWLKEQGPVNVVVRWDALANEGIDEGTPVTLSLKQTSVAKILAETLEQISETETVLFRGVGNTIKISTKTDLNRKLYVRVYDISDILVRVPDFTGAPQVDLTRSQSGGGGGGGQDENIFGDEGDDDGDEGDELEYDERIAALIELIQTTVEPESWLDMGGRGTVMAFNKMLVVRNSIEVHEAIGGPFVLD